MASVVSSTAYRDRIHASLGEWPEFSWLNRFFQTTQPAGVDDQTVVYVSDLCNGQLLTHRVEGDLLHLQSELCAEVENSSLRFVFLCHADSWSINRDLLDVVCSHFELDPRVVVGHLDYPGVVQEKHFPSDLHEKIDHLRYEYSESYPWEVGGELTSPFDEHVGRSFRFYYEEAGMTVIPSRGATTTNVLVLYRCDPRKKSSIFWNQHSHAMMFDKSHRASKPTVYTQIEYLLERLNGAFDGIQSVSSNFAIRSVVLMFVDCLVCAAYANYHRAFSPAALTPFNLVRLTGDDLTREMRQVQNFNRQVEAFNRQYPIRGDPDPGDAACHILGNLMVDLQRLEELDRAQLVSMANDDLRNLIEDQTKETKESTNTSVQIGRLSRLAYVFLPMQITTSLLGMNLEIFGSGTLNIGTFIAILICLGLLSFIPIMSHKRVSQCSELWQYSRRVSIIFACFCATHASDINDILWGCGISWDLFCFGNPTYGKRSVQSRPSYEDAWLKNRHRMATKLRSDRLSFFPTFWQAKVNEIFEIIDQPRWGREKIHYP